MGGRRLAVNIALRHPRTDQVVVFEAGQVLPDWAAALITNEAVWADDPVDTPAVSSAQADPEPDVVDVVAGEVELDDLPDIDPPPRTGPGSNRAAWVAYAEAVGAPTPPTNVSRDAIIQALAEAGIRVD